MLLRDVPTSVPRMEREAQSARSLEQPWMPLSSRINSSEKGGNDSTCINCDGNNDGVPQTAAIPSTRKVDPADDEQHARQQQDEPAWATTAYPQMPKRREQCSLNSETGRVHRPTWNDLRERHRSHAGRDNDACNDFVIARHLCLSPPNTQAHRRERPVVLKLETTRPARVWSIDLLDHNALPVVSSKDASDG